MKEKYLKFISIFGLIIIIFLFISNCIKINFVQDDAYTTFRYVRNFVEGNGLVFNYGERVEGYTSFLFVMLLSASFKIGLIIENSAQLLSILFGVFALIITYKLSNLFVNNSISSSNNYLLKLLKRIIVLLPVYLLSVTGGFIYWAVSGMEATLFVFLILSLLYFHRDQNISGKVNYKFLIIIILAVFTRPEGVIFYFILLVNDLFFGKLLIPDNINRKINIKTLLKEATIIGLFVGTYICFRLIYYGYPLPNTYYAKTHFSFESFQYGMKYFFDFLKAYLLYGVVLIAPIILMKSKKFKETIAHLYFMILLYLGLIVFIGGDVLPFHRFFLPVLPLIYILFICSLQYVFQLIAPKVRNAEIVLHIVIIIFAIGIGLFNQSSEHVRIIETRNYEAGLVKKMKIYARWINDRQQESNKKYQVALSTIGAFSFFSGSKVIDIIGLTNEFIAHNPKEVEGINDELPILWKERHYNADYVLSQKPDYIIFPAGAKPSAFPECAIFVQKDFYDNYYPQLIYSSELNQLLPIYTKNSLLNGVDCHKKDTSYNCNQGFMKHYIIAYNLFLKLINNKNANLFTEIERECKEIIYFCPSRKSDAYTILGMANYHISRYDEAEKYFLKAVDMDSCNSISHYYLKNIFLAKEDSVNAINSIREIMKYSPYALPNLIYISKN